MDDQRVETQPDEPAWYTEIRRRHVALDLDGEWTVLRSYHDDSTLGVPATSTSLYVRCPQCNCRHHEYRAREKGHCYNCGEFIRDTVAVEESDDPHEFTMPTVLVNAIISNHAAALIRRECKEMAGSVFSLRLSEEETKWLREQDQPVSTILRDLLHRAMGLTTKLQITSESSFTVHVPAGGTALVMAPKDKPDD